MKQTLAVSNHVSEPFHTSSCSEPQPALWRTETARIQNKESFIILLFISTWNNTEASERKYVFMSKFVVLEISSVMHQVTLFTEETVDVMATV